MNIANQILDSNDIHRACELEYIDTHETTQGMLYTFEDGSQLILDWDIIR